MAIFYHLCFTYLNVSTLVFRQKKKIHICVYPFILVWPVFRTFCLTCSWRTWRNLNVKSKILHLENMVEKMAKETSCYQEEICILCFGE